MVPLATETVSSVVDVSACLIRSTAPEKVEPIGMEDGDVLDLGHHKLVWQSTPHLPHGWECGYFFDKTTQTLFCGDLFTQPGMGKEPLVSDDILGPSEAMRAGLDAALAAYQPYVRREELALGEWFAEWHFLATALAAQVGDREDLAGEGGERVGVEEGARHDLQCLSRADDKRALPRVPRG